jgi:RNA recognition motif-containing protein
MNLYVGNLPWTCSEEDRDSGRSKGFGFVEMTDSNGGSAAIEALDGNDFSGRDLRVNEAKERS